MTTALILAGHGSHISPNTAGIVWEYVDILRARGAADEITAGFWKEVPHFNQVLKTVAAERVIVVPLFTAQGFFSEEVIPAEMGLTDTLTQHNQQTILRTPPIGTHAQIADVVNQRVQNTLQQHNLNSDETAVAIIGHGTPRNRASRNTTQRQVQLLQEQHIVAEVLDAYLDDEPYIPSIYERTPQPNLIVVPFFLAIGSHVLIDVPNALGIDPQLPQQEVQGKQAFYTEPVGTAETICDLVLDLAYQADLSKRETTSINIWSGFPQVGQREFITYLIAQNNVVIGELSVTPYTVEPLTNTSHPVLLNTPADVREFVRENPFRPLATQTNLPTGWRVQLPQPKDAHAVIETIYPGVLADWAQWRNNAFKTETLAEVRARQVGMFKDIENLTTTEIERTVTSLCGNCIRQPTWFVKPQATEKTHETIPCATPCNLWLSQSVRGE